MKTPRLSIIIPLHNCAYFIRTMLDSIYAQSIRNDLEIIVVDDFSTDNGVELIKEWSAQKGMPVHILENKKQEFALRSRLNGLSIAHAPHILFADADDILWGKDNLEKALLISEQSTCDITHCYCITINEDGKIGNDTPWLNPMADKLEGSDVFSTYMACDYPPPTLWTKIFSRTLLDTAVSKIKQERLFNFDDKFLTSLLMLFANSYIKCDEFIYQYRLPDRFGLEHHAGRVRDLYTTLDTLLPLMEELKTKPETIQNCIEYIRKRIAINMNKLSLEAEPLLRGNPQNIDTIFKKISPYLTEELFAHAIIIANAYNAGKISTFLGNWKYDY